MQKFFKFYDKLVILFMVYFVLLSGQARYIQLKKKYSGESIESYWRRHTMSKVLKCRLNNDKKEIELFIPFGFQFRFFKEVHIFSQLMYGMGRRVISISQVYQDKYDNVSLTKDINWWTSPCTCEKCLSGKVNIWLERSILKIHELRSSALKTSGYDEYDIVVKLPLESVSDYKRYYFHVLVSNQFPKDSKDPKYYKSGACFIMQFRCE